LSRCRQAGPCRGSRCRVQESLRTCPEVLRPPGSESRNLMSPYWTWSAALQRGQRPNFWWTQPVALRFAAEDAHAERIERETSICEQALETHDHSIPAPRVVVGQR